MAKYSENAKNGPIYYIVITHNVRLIIINSVLIKLFHARKGITDDDYELQIPRFALKLLIFVLL